MIPFPSIALHNTCCAFGSPSFPPYQRTLPKLTAQEKGRESGQHSLIPPSSNSNSLRLSARAVMENNSGVIQGTSTLSNEKSDNHVCLLHWLGLAVLLKETEKWKLKKKSEKAITKKKKNSNHLTSPVRPPWPECWSQILLIAVQISHWQYCWLEFIWSCHRYMPVHGWCICQLMVDISKNPS